MNSVNNIITSIFQNNLTCELKSELKEMAPPRPVLNISKDETSQNKTVTRKFNMHLYNSESWLCGCDVRNAFFCYVCLVINAMQSDHAWIRRGITDLKHLGEKIKRHRVTERHMNNCIEFSMLGRVDISTQLDSAYRLQISEHNENVQRNRYILNKIIDCVKFCGLLEIASSSSSTNSDHPGIFRGLNLMAELDTLLKELLDKTKDKSFIDLSKTIQNDLLDSMYAVCLDLIYKQIEQADYVAIQAYEATDCATLSQMVFIVRYELNGCVYERFLGFLLAENHTSVEGVSEIIFKQLEDIKINETPEKLISQSYDGSSIMSDRNSGVQAKIKELYPNAHYIHCYAQQLNLIVECASIQDKQVRIFFSNLEGFSLFFSSSPKRIAVLDEVVKKRMPKDSSTRWDFKSSKCLITVFAHKMDIITCFEQLINDPINDLTTIREAGALMNCLKDDDFNFWLDFFNKIMSNCDVVLTQLHQEIDAVKVRACVETFKSLVQEVRDSIDYEFYKEEIDIDDGDSPAPHKRPRYEDFNKIIAKKVCDTLLTSIEDRFSFNNHLTIGVLFEPKLFTKHKLLFPADEVETASVLFNVNENLLKHELKVIYNRPDFSSASGALILLKCFYDNNLTHVFPQSVKLLKILCTLPMSTTESERCFCTLTRVKTFIRNTVKEDKLSALAMLSVERKLVQETQNFNELVIDHFARINEKSIYLMYKNVNTLYIQN